MSQKFTNSNFVIENFRLVTSKIRYFEFPRKIVNFSLQTLGNIGGKLMRTKDEFQRISFALLLHSTLFTFLGDEIKKL